MGNGDNGIMGNLPVALLAAALAGGGSSVGLNMLNDPRPDPWTGTDAREAHRSMEHDWTERHNRLEGRIDELQRRMDLRFDRLQNIIMDRHQ